MTVDSAPSCMPSTLLVVSAPPMTPPSMISTRKKSVRMPSLKTAAHEGRTTTSTARRKEKRNVHWNQGVLVRRSLPLARYSSEEIRDSWYHMSEYDAMRKNFQRHEEEDRSSRLNKYLERRVVTLAVLREQDEQYATGIVDEEALAMVCHRARKMVIVRDDATTAIMAPPPTATSAVRFSQKDRQ